MGELDSAIYNDARTLRAYFGFFFFSRQQKCIEGERRGLNEESSCNERRKNSTQNQEKQNTTGRRLRCVDSYKSPSSAKCGT